MASYFTMSFVVVLTSLSGWLLTVFMGHLQFPKAHLERAAVGPIWIAIVFILLFWRGIPLSTVNLLSGLAIAGSLARSFWEHGLRCYELAAAAEEVERMLNPAPVQVTTILHYANRHESPPRGLKAVSIVPWSGH